MDPASPGEASPLTLCPCSCPFCCQSSPYRWHRSVKRKAESDSPDSIPTYTGIARVQTESELTLLRETISNQLEMIQNLSVELEEERNAASSAANEAMAMILKLQREKAEALMEVRQFKRFAEEKMAHDDEELISLEDLLLKRDEMLQSLSSKLYAYRLKFQKLGFSDSDLEGDFDELYLSEYPPLKCTAPTPVPEFEENPSEELNTLEQRIFKLEKQEDQEIEINNDIDDDNNNKEDYEDDDLNDRVYMVDTVYGPSETPRVRVSEEKDVDIKKLYMRLEALEADRESMRQALISMRTEKAQLVLLQEIAQHLSKGHERTVVLQKKKKSFLEAFSIFTLFKWLLSLVFKHPRIRYTFGLSTQNVGLLVILDKTPQMSQLRCHAKVRISKK